jgi:hypothetical protein
LADQLPWPWLMCTSITAPAVRALLWDSTAVSHEGVTCSTVLITVSGIDDPFRRAGRLPVETIWGRRPGQQPISGLSQAAAV